LAKFHALTPGSTHFTENNMALQIGFLLFPNVQPLDLCGPWDVFASMPDTSVRLVGKTRDSVVGATGLRLTPDTTFDDCPPLDVICVPGGSGVGPLLDDDVTLDFVRRQASGARYVTSVCTGALVLGAAGLLRGRRATTHWAFHTLLEPFGAIAVQDRVVRDGNLITGGGITAGIDFALTLAAELIGVDAAQDLQLELEYAPAPPFDAGNPASAPAAVVERVRALNAASLAERTRLVERAAAKLASGRAL
jgi:cyclohexyl-isocyanide hydratase